MGPQRARDCSFPVNHCYTFDNLICSGMALQLYAEYLPRIATLSVQATLKTPCNSGTSASISNNGTTFTLAHEGARTTIELPVSMGRGDNDRILPIDCSSNMSLEFRVPISVGEQRVVDDEPITPWTAASLSSDTEVSCKSCATVLMSGGVVSSWKDLPSDNWADMMDLWHCHKPNEPHDQAHTTTKKGYAAGNTLQVTSSICLVNAVTFLAAAEDCQNVKVSNEESYWHFPDPLSLVFSIYPYTSLDIKNRHFQVARSISGEESGYKCPIMTSRAWKSTVLWCKSWVILRICSPSAVSLSYLGAYEYGGIPEQIHLATIYICFFTSRYPYTVQDRH
jgi:hypothetical protein